MGSRVPHLANLFSFNMPALKLVSIIILIVGTFVLFGQVSKMVSITPAMFSNNAIRYEQGKQHFERPEDSRQIFEGNQTSQNEQYQNVRKGKGFHRREEISSFSQLAGNISNLLLYSSALGSIAFYTYLVARRPKKLL